MAGVNRGWLYITKSGSNTQKITINLSQNRHHQQFQSSFAADNKVQRHCSPVFNLRRGEFERKTGRVPDVPLVDQLTISRPVVARVQQGE